MSTPAVARDQNMKLVQGAPKVSNCPEQPEVTPCECQGALGPRPPALVSGAYARQHQLAAMSARHVDDEVDGVRADRLPFRLRQLHPVEAALAVHRRCTHAPLGEWPATAHGQRHIDARQLDDGKRIARGVLHGVVTVHSRRELHAIARQLQMKRDRVD
jgi:hypothetical protein